MAAKSAFSLLDQLEMTGCQAALLTSFNVYFPFFEQVVLRKLHAVGCSHVILFADARMCAESFQSELTRPQRAGTDYVLVPVRMEGAFHPKLLLQLGRTKGALCVGSHNLTLSGFGLNDEITNVITKDGKGAPDAAFRAAVQFLRQFVPALPAVGEAFQAALDVAPWLDQPASVDPMCRLVGSRQDGEPLWHALRGDLPRGARRALVVGPYFDDQLAFLRRLLEELEPEQLIVALDPEGLEVEPARFTELPRTRVVRAPGRIHVEGRRDGPTPRLHGKLLWLDTPQGEVLASGSANPSVAAFLAPAGRRNAEAVVIRKGRGLAEQLDLGTLLGAPAISPEEWQLIQDRQARVPPPLPSRGGPVYLAVAAPPGFVVDGQLEATGPGLALGPDSAGLGKVTVVQSGPSTLLRANEAAAESALRLELPTASGLAHVVVHQPEAISRNVGQDTRKALREALGGLDDDPAQLETLLKLTEKVIFDAGEVVRPPVSVAGGHSLQGVPGAEGGEEAPQAEEQGDSLAMPARGPKRGKLRRSIARGDIVLLLEALVSRLGRGLPPNMALPKQFSEDEGELRDDEPPPPPPSLERLAEVCQRKVNNLCRRMRRQLGQNRDDYPARRLVVQLAAVLALLRALDTMERRDEWRKKSLKLLDDEELTELMRDALIAAGDPRTDLLSRAVEQNDNEPFEELGTAAALLGWLAWRCGVDVRLAEIREGRLGVEEEHWYWLQLLGFAATTIVESDTAQALWREAVLRSPRRGEDPTAWLAAHLSLLEALALLTWAPDDAPPLNRASRPGDLVVLPEGREPRVRLVLDVEDATSGRRIRVLDFKNEDGQAAFLESRMRLTSPGAIMAQAQRASA